MSILTCERIDQAARVIVEDVDRPVLVAARGELAVAAQIHTHAKAARVGAASLILANHLGRILIQDIPHKDLPVPRRRREVLPALIKRNRPYRRILGDISRHLVVRAPFTRVRAGAPDLDLAAEAGARSYLSILGGAEVVAAEGVGAADGLREVEGGRGGVVDVDARGAAG